MSDQIREHVEHIAAELTAGTDAQWAHHWHESNCRLWVPEADQEPEEGEEVETLEDHLEWCDERPTAYDWLEDVLDIEYTVNREREFLGARVLVAFGGPNIWVDVRRDVVEGYWWGDEATASFTDNLNLYDALEDLYSMY